MSLVGFLFVYNIFAGVMTEKKYRISTFELVVYPDMKPLKLVMYEDENTIEIHRIEIYANNASKPFQVFNKIESENMNPAAPHRIAVIDMNFDGYKDFRVVSWVGSTWNRGYHVWLYNPKSGRFCYDVDLSNLSSPIVFDARTQTVSTFSKGGSAAAIHSRYDYKFIAGKLTRVKRYEQTFDKKFDRYVYTIWKRINGKMVKVEHAVVPWK